MTPQALDDLELAHLKASRDLQSQRLQLMNKQITVREKRQELARYEADIPITERTIAALEQQEADLRAQLEAARTAPPTAP